MKRAWLITWEDWKGKMDNNVVDILDSRVWDNKIKELMERYYMNTQFLSDRLNYTKSKKTPYPAKLDRISCINWCWKIFCGHSPYLYARRVKNLEIWIDWNWEEYLVYDEIDKRILEEKIIKTDL